MSDDPDFGIDPELVAALSELELVRFVDRVVDGDFARVREELRLESVAAASAAARSDDVRVRPFALETADGARVDLRVYSPAGVHSELPALLYFHGGGFMVGGLDSEDSHCRAFAGQTSCVVVSVDYRLAPEHRFPTGLQDCCAAVGWVHEHAGELAVDRDRIGIAGASAGGALAAGVALWARDSGLAPGLSLQMLLYPALDDRLSTRSTQECVATPIWETASCQLMWASYLPEPFPAQRDRAAEDWSAYAAPGLAADVTRLPPTMILTAGADPLRDEGLEYATRLAQAGCPVELHHFAAGFHGFDMHFPDAALSRHALAAQCAFLRRHR